MNLKCRIFGHKRKYNFSTMPNKCICVRCKTKWKWNLDMHSDWEKVESFKGETRTDQELINKWVDMKY